MMRPGPADRQVRPTGPGINVMDLGARPKTARQTRAFPQGVIQPDANVTSMDAYMKNDTNDTNDTNNGNDI